MFKRWFNDVLKMVGQHVTIKLEASGNSKIKRVHMQKDAVISETEDKR